MVDETMRITIAVVAGLAGFIASRVVAVPPPEPVQVNVTSECRDMVRELVDQHTAVADVLMMEAQRQTGILEWSAAERNTYSPDLYGREQLDRARENARARIAPLNPYEAR